MLLQRTCKTCGRSFEGGPRAYYCPTCRIERRKEQDRLHKRKARLGLVRKIGSTDTCEQCRQPYIVDGGLQRFCPDCQPLHAAEYDAATSLEHYHSHKDEINPKRNERRRITPKTCAVCQKEYQSPTRTLTCSDECRRILTNRKWVERYNRLKTQKSDRPEKE